MLPREPSAAARIDRPPAPPLSRRTRTRPPARSRRTHPRLSPHRRPQQRPAVDRLALEADRLALPPAGRHPARPVVPRPRRCLLHSRATAASRRTRSSTSRSPRSRCALVGSSGRTGARASPARVRTSFRPPTMPMSCATARSWSPTSATAACSRLSRRGAIVGEIGSAGRCLHDPPRSLLAPNGATPLPPRWRARDRDRRLHRPD